MQSFFLRSNANRKAKRQENVLKGFINAVFLIHDHHTNFNDD